MFELFVLDRKYISVKDVFFINFFDNEMLKKFFYLEVGNCGSFTKTD